MLFSKKTIALAAGVLLAASLFAQSASLRRGNKNYELSDFKEAVKNYQEVLDKSPNHLEANSKIADCLRILNDLDRALGYYENAVAQSGVSDLTVFQYGLTLQGTGRYDLARQVFDRLADNSSDFRERARQFSEAATFAMGGDGTPLFKVSNEYANSSASDFGAALFKGDRVVYASSRSDIRTRDNRSTNSSTDGGNRLLATQRDKNGFLETPVTLHAGFKGASNEGPIAYSPAGEWVAITKNNFRDGVRQIPSSGLEMTLHLAQVDETGDWTSATPFAHNGTERSTGYPAFSPEGNALYFASDRAGGYGGYDLYVSYKTGSSWSTPENLGAVVNSLGNEISPFHDGTSLHFASDYHRGYGGFDIFRAEEGSADRWATVYHGGAGLNSSADDYGFTFDRVRNIGYFTSNRPGGRGGEDIYRITKETDNVVVKVTDALTGKPLADAEIDFSSCGDRSYTTNASGVFNFQLVDENLNCTATVRKEGYLSADVRITSSGLRSSRALNVSLTSKNAAYSGRTVNGWNGYVLEDVKVIATQQKSGEVSEAFSDLRGEYVVALQANSTYLLRYSKAGFRDVSLNLQTGQKDAKNIPQVELLPVGVADSGKRLEDAGAGSSSSSPSSGVASTVPSGYSVQVAASTASSVDLAPYEKKVGKTGKVYSVDESGKTKIRVGVFPTRKEAEAAQKTLKSKGYAGTFIVEEFERAATSGAASATSAITPKGDNRPAAASSSNLEGFMVRLATYGDLKNFDASKVDDLGDIVRVPKGKLTVILLGGFRDRASAEDAARKAKGRGFPDAYLVTQEGGELRKFTAKGVDSYDFEPATPRDLDGYMVRLATYSDLTSFDASKVDDLGDIVRYPKGSVTIVLLSGFRDKASAEIAVRKAKGRGFPDAYLVMEDGGEFRKPK